MLNDEPGLVNRNLTVTLSIYVLASLAFSVLIAIFIDQFSALSRYFSSLIGVSRDSSLSTYIVIVLIFLIAVFVTVSISRLMRRSLAKETDNLENKSLMDEITMDKSSSTNFRLAVAHLDRRIRNLSERSSAIYWTIVVTLFAGVVLIIFAGRLSSLDSTWAVLDSHLAQLRESLVADREVYYRAVSDNWHTAYKAWLDANLTPAAATGSATAKLTTPLSFPSSMELEYPASFVSREQLIQQMETNLQNAMIQRASQAADSRPEWNWPSTVLRVSVIGLLVFLTQIMITLYRYNSRLITFYVSRREALIMSKGDAKLMAEYVDVLFPKSLDFGREPKHPFAEAGSLIARFKPGARTREEKGNADSGGI